MNTIWLNFVGDVGGVRLHVNYKDSDFKTRNAGYDNSWDDWKMINKIKKNELIAGIYQEYQPDFSWKLRSQNNALARSVTNSRIFSDKLRTPSFSSTYFQLGRQYARG